VAPSDTLAAFCEEADEIVCLQPQMALGAIAFYYRDFHQMTDGEVTDLLTRASRATQRPFPTHSAAGATKEAEKADR
jgi:predicted phosphoribosyltransferase